MKTDLAQCAVNADLAPVLAFLIELGLTIRCVEQLPDEGFMSDVRIVDGGLNVLPHALVSNVLHEAGHLAVLPSRFRASANDDVDSVIETMLNTLAAEGEDPDGVAMRQAMQAGETEATAWAWAAGQHLGVAPECIIRDDDYDGTGAELRFLLHQGRYLGIHGLAHGGLTTIRPMLGETDPLRVFPRMVRWLQV